MSAFNPLLVRKPVVHQPKRHRLPAPERWQPAEHDGKNENQQNADQEHRQRDAHERSGEQNLREPGISTQCGIHARGNADGERQQCGSERKLERRGHPLLQQRRDRPALAQRQTEIPLHRPTDEASELDVERLVQAEVSAQPRPIFLGCVLTDHEGDRVAGEIEQPEGDERNHRHDHDGLEDTTKNESEHVRRSCPKARGASMDTSC